MKKIILSLLILIVNKVNAQQDKVFSITPISDNTANVNGLAVGIGNTESQHIVNGLNIDVDPLVLFYLLAPKAIEYPEESKANVSLNGLHISTGGYIGGGTVNGINISSYHIVRKNNGVSVTFFNNTTMNTNGLQLALMSNSSDKLNGASLAIWNEAIKCNGVELGAMNYAEQLKGLQIGVYNSSDISKGIQIGLFNKSNSRSGIQIGFWNKNAKRSLPILNF